MRAHPIVRLGFTVRGFTKKFSIRLLAMGYQVFP